MFGLGMTKKAPVVEPPQPADEPEEAVETEKKEEE